MDLLLLMYNSNVEDITELFLIKINEDTSTFRKYYFRLYDNNELITMSFAP